MRDIQIGSTVFNDWTVIKKIGKGQFSDVYLIERNASFGFNGQKTRSALKVIHVDRNHDPHYRQKIEEEAAIMSHFRGHSNIVYYEDFQYLPDPESGDRYAVFLIKMELLSPLNKINKNWSPDEVVKMGTDLCNALESCEQENVLHRDIKPYNIFVSDFGNFELGDFGESVVMEGQYTTGLHGTFAYMAPEVASKQAYTFNADMYSLAMVLYQYLNQNRLPFMTSYANSVTKEEVEYANQTRFGGNTIPDIQGIHPGLNYVLKKALDFHPEKRYQSAAAFRNDLQNYKNFPPHEEIILDDPEPPVPEPTPAPRGLIIAICAISIALIIGIGGYFAWSYLDLNPGPKVNSCEGMSIFEDDFSQYRTKLLKQGYHVELEPATVGTVNDAGKITEYDYEYCEDAKKEYTIIYYYVSAPDVIGLPQDTAIGMLEVNDWNYSISIAYDCSENPVQEGCVFKEELDEHDPSTVILYVYTAN